MGRKMQAWSTSCRVEKGKDKGGEDNDFQEEGGAVNRHLWQFGDM